MILFLSQLLCNTYSVTMLDRYTIPLLYFLLHVDRWADFSCKVIFSPVVPWVLHWNQMFQIFAHTPMTLALFLVLLINLWLFLFVSLSDTIIKLENCCLLTLILPKNDYWMCIYPVPLNFSCVCVVRLIGPLFFFFVTIYSFILMIHFPLCSVLVPAQNYIMYCIRHHMRATCLHHFLFWLVLPELHLCHINIILTCIELKYYWWLVNLQLNMCKISQFQGWIFLYLKMKIIVFLSFGKKICLHLQ